MMVINFLLGGVLLIIGIVLSIKAIRGLSIVGRLLRRPTLAVSRLKEGPIEVSGKVTAVGEPLISLSGQRCVAVKTIVSGQSGSGDDSTSKGSKTVQRVAPTRLVDATGQCRLDLDLSDVLGERWVSKKVSEAELAYVPWSDLVPPGSTEVTIEEFIIPEGATVLVSGDAAQETKDPEGYRDGKAAEWVISGTAEQLLLLSIGGQTRLIARTVGIASVVFAVGGYLVTLGTVMMVVALSS